MLSPTVSHRFRNSKLTNLTDPLLKRWGLVTADRICLQVMALNCPPSCGPQQRDVRLDDKISIAQKLEPTLRSPADPKCKHHY